MVSSSTTNISSENINPTCHNNDLIHVNVINPSSFKGIWKQKNGHWGAQIYAPNRIWLGTFRSDTEAAMAYDSASIKLQIRDAHRNFPWNEVTIHEPNFQKQFSTEAILSMIKDGSYPSKFMEYLNSIGTGGNDRNLNLDTKNVNGLVSCTELFRKELTPSDVGKLNRLVIPKKCALRYFSNFSEDAKGNSEENGEAEIVSMKFFDRSTLRLWEFRYCYWKSSQSFVFTKGWSRFVKDKELRINDGVIFYKCECLEKLEIKMFYMIDIAYKDRLYSDEKNKMDIEQENSESVVEKLEMDIEQKDGNCRNEEDSNEAKFVLQLGKSGVESRGIRIFGVQMY